MDKNIKGISILESLVCLVIIGIGFVAMLQLSSFSINVADRTIENNKINHRLNFYKVENGSLKEIF